MGLEAGIIKGSAGSVADDSVDALLKAGSKADTSASKDFGARLEEAKETSLPAPDKDEKDFSIVSEDWDDSATLVSSRRDSGISLNDERPEWAKQQTGSKAAKSDDAKAADQAPHSATPGATSASKEEVDDLSARLDEGISDAQSALTAAIKGGDKDEIAKATKDLKTLKDAKEMFDPDPAKQEAAIGKNAKSAKEELADLKEKKANDPDSVSDEEMAAAEKKASYLGRMKETWGKMDSGQKALALLGLAGAIGGPMIGIYSAAQSQNFDKQKMSADQKSQLAQTQYSNAFSMMQGMAPKASNSGVGVQ